MISDADFEKRYPLRFPEATEVIEKLKHLPRTGWLQWDISQADAETVFEHTQAARKMAVSYKDQLGLSDDELKELIDMIEIHDWPEALVGDGVILGDEEDVEKLRAHKKARELEAMATICDSLPDGAHILSLYVRYANGDDKLAKLTKQIEKLQAVFKAVEYENKYKKVGLTKEFIHYTKDLIHDSFLQTEMKAAASQLLPVALFFSTFSSAMISVLFII